MLGQIIIIVSQLNSAPVTCSTVLALASDHLITLLNQIESGKFCCSTGVGKTQIQNILNDKEEIRKRLAAGECSDRKYTNVRKMELDKTVWNGSLQREQKISQ